jgi:hypothetical protein
MENSSLAVVNSKSYWWQAKILNEKVSISSNQHPATDWMIDYDEMNNDFEIDSKFCLF